MVLGDVGWMQMPSRSWSCAWIEAAIHGEAGGNAWRLGDVQRRTLMMADFEERPATLEGIKGCGEAEIAR